MTRPTTAFLPPIRGSSVLAAEARTWCGPAALPTPRRPVRTGSRVLLDAAKEHIAKEMQRLGVSSKEMMFAKTCPRTSQDWKFRCLFESLLEEEASHQRRGYAMSSRIRAANSSAVQCGPLPNTKRDSSLLLTKSKHLLFSIHFILEKKKLPRISILENSFRHPKTITRQF